MIVMVHIIIAEWGGYRLWRQKSLLLYTVDCGLAPLLSSLSSVEPGLPFKVTLVVNDLDPVSVKQYDYLQDQYSFIDDILCRSNEGFDIGAYNTGIQHLRSLSYAGDVILMNTGVKGPSQANWLSHYHRFFHSVPQTGLVGLSTCSRNTYLKRTEFQPHLQSFFLMSTMPILDEVFPESIPGSQSTTKEAVITEGEIAISTQILSFGYSIRCPHYPNFRYSSGQKWPYPERESRFDPTVMSEGHRI